MSNTTGGHERVTAHQKISKKNVAVSNLVVLETMSDQITMNLINCIAKGATNSENLIQLLNISPKQYYDRSSKLLKIDLIKRENGEFYLTAFGKLVHNSQMKVALAFKHSQKLKAIDILRSNTEITEHELKRLIDSLIDDPELMSLIT